MRSLLLVARREFTTRSRSFAYKITTTLMVFMLGFVTIYPAWMQQQSDSAPIHLLLLDQTGSVAERLKQALAGAADLPGGRPITVEVVTGDAEALKPRVLKEKLAMLVVRGTVPDAVEAQYFGSTPAVMQGAGVVTGLLESMVRSAAIQQHGLSPEAAQKILSPLKTEAAQITEGGGKRDLNAFMGAYTLAMGITMVLYMVVLINGQFVFMGVLEEKVSRVVEVMASTVGAVEMLAGKVLGLGALGLVQFVAMILAWYGGNRIAGQIAGSQAQSLPIGKALIAFAFLVLGYTLIATLMAAAASTISKMEDQQAVMMPIMMLVVIPFILMPSTMNDPDSTYAVVLSLLPFCSQSVMVFRVMLTDVPAWQVAVSLLLMLLTAALTTWAGGRVYRAALLSYGGRPSLKQVWNYLRAG